MLRIRVSTALAAIAVMTGTFAEPVLAQTDETVSEATENSTRESSWYGQRYALNGQDVVSFRAETGPVKGSDNFVAEWDNTHWKFATAESRDAFLENPEYYAPQFGGYCPVALSKGEVKIGSAKHFNVVDDKLYLNYNEETSGQFHTNPTGYIAGAKLTF